MYSSKSQRVIIGTGSERGTVTVDIYVVISLLSASTLFSLPSRVCGIVCVIDLEWESTGHVFPSIKALLFFYEWSTNALLTL
jgi:hypothetical protein